MLTLAASLSELLTPSLLLGLVGGVVTLVTLPLIIGWSTDVRRELRELRAGAASTKETLAGCVVRLRALETDVERLRITMDRLEELVYRSAGEEP